MPGLLISIFEGLASILSWAIRAITYMITIPVGLLIAMSIAFAWVWFFTVPNIVEREIEEAKRVYITSIEAATLNAHIKATRERITVLKREVDNLAQQKAEEEEARANAEELIEQLNLSRSDLQERLNEIAKNRNPDMCVPTVGELRNNRSFN